MFVGVGCSWVVFVVFVVVVLVVAVVVVVLVVAFLHSCLLSSII